VRVPVFGPGVALGVRALPQLRMAIAVLVGWLLVPSRRAALGDGPVYSLLVPAGMFNLSIRSERA